MVQGQVAAGDPLALAAMTVRGGKEAPACATAEAYLLSGVGGCVDAIGLLTLGGLFVAHMSGNSAAFGAAFGQGDWRTGLPHLFAVPIFIAGLFLGYVWILRSPTYKRCAVMLLIEAVLLAIFALSLAFAGSPVRNSVAYFLFATPPLLAMGLQNATLRQVGRSAFPSTYVTGVLDTFAKSIAIVSVKGGGSGAEIATARRAACLWLCYALGALSGGVGLLAFRSGILLIPLAILLVVAARFLLAGGTMSQGGTK